MPVYTKRVNTVGMKTLPEFIRALGDDAAASLFQITPRAVAAYRRGERVPRRSVALRIVAMTADHPDGPVSWAGIYCPSEPDGGLTSSDEGKQHA